MVSDVLKSSTLVDMIIRNKHRIADLKMEINNLLIRNSVLEEVQAEVGARVEATIHAPPGHTEPTRRQELDKPMTKCFGKEEAKELGRILDETELKLKEKSHADK